jgi:hypothetical protein
MKTGTLRALVKSLEDERGYLEAATLIVSSDLQIKQCEQRAGKIASIVAHLRAEITARANPCKRNPDEAQRFDDYLQRAIEIHLGLEPAKGGEQEHQAA